MIELKVSLPESLCSQKELLTVSSSSLCVLKDFGGGLAVIPFMGLLESIAIAKAFGK